MKKLLILASTILFIQTVSAGAISAEQAIEIASESQRTSLELLTILSKSNFKDTHCDIRYYQDSAIEILCNTDDNSVVAIINYFNDSDIIIESRPGQQVDVGPGPITSRLN
jgi:hypothetical protein